MNIFLENMKIDIFNKKYDFENFKNIITLITSFSTIKRREDAFKLELLAYNLEKFYSNVSLFKDDVLLFTKLLVDNYDGAYISEVASNIYWQNKDNWEEDKKVIFYILARGFAEIAQNDNQYKTGMILSSLFLDTSELEKNRILLYSDIDSEYNLLMVKRQYGKELEEIVFLLNDRTNNYTFSESELKKLKKVDKYISHITIKDLHTLLHNTNIKDIENVFFLLNIDAKRKIFNDRTNKFKNNMRMIESTKTFPEKNKVLESCDNILNVLDNFDRF